MPFTLFERVRARREERRRATELASSIRANPQILSRRFSRAVSLINALFAWDARAATKLRSVLRDAIAAGVPQPQPDQTGPSRTAIKLAYFAGAPIPTRDANCVHVMKMCNALSRRCRVVLFAERSREPAITMEALFEDFAVDEFGVSLADREGSKKFASILGVRSAIEAGCTHCMGRSVASSYAAALTGMPTILERHSPVHPSEIEMFRDLIRLPAFRGLVVITGVLRDHFLAAYELAPDRVHVVADAADAPRVSEPFSFKGPSDSFRIGYAGHLYAGKAAELIVDLAARMPEVTFHLLGGYDTDAEPWKRKANGLENIFFYGHRPHREVSNFLSGLDVALAPYQRKVSAAGGQDVGQWMSPLKLFEYMAHGLPIVCSDLPVLREVVQHRVNALLCDPEDAESWRTALQVLRDNAGLRERLGRRAAEDFKARYTWDQRAERLYRLALG